MPLVNINVTSSSACRVLISWTVIQVVETGLTFSDLFAKIVSGAYSTLSVEEELSHSCLEKVYVGPSRDLLSCVDEKLLVEDVCCAFGQHVKFSVSRHENPAPSTSQPLRNAFTVLMNSQRALDAGKKLPSKVVAVTKKDELFNDLVSYFEKEGWHWTRDGESIGRKFITAIRNCLWYVDGHNDTLSNRGHPIPATFEAFKEYNVPELSKHRKRSHTNMSSDVLRKHAGCLKEFLLSPWMKQQKWAAVKIATEQLAESLDGYASELRSKKRLVAEQNRTEVVEASDDISFSVLNIAVLYPDILNPLIEALREKECYQPVFIRDFAPVDRRERYSYIRHLEKGLPMKCIMFTKSFGSSIGNYQYIWKIPHQVTIENALSENERVVRTILSELPKYHSRSLKREFISKFGRFSPVTKPYILRDIYRELTGDCSASSNTHEEEIDKRLQEAILMEDPDVHVDLRELNSNGSDRFGVFWKHCEAFLQECTAVHERRHDTATYLARALSVRDLVEQVSKKCPTDTPIPSLQWVRLQFFPKNPRTKTAALYRKRLPIKMMVQKRQFRKSHIDDHYCAALFRYQRQYALMLRDECLFICLDDKHRLKVGEPGFPVAAAERGRRVIVSLNEQFQVGDHDFTRFSIIPSVIFQIDVPDSIEGSWYDGQVCVMLKEAAFQPSSALRHATELSSWLTTRIDNRSVLFLYTDGGPDHRLNFVSTQLSLVALFLNLDLDLLCAARTAPNQSWRNPVERMMSIVNLGLQSIGLMRKEMNADAEKALKNCNSLKQIRAAGEPFKQEISQSIQQPIDLVQDVMSRLELKGKKFEVDTGCSGFEEECFWEVLQQIEPSLASDDTTRERIKDKNKLQAFFDHCCQSRHYTFCIKKCGQNDCGICKPVRMDKDKFSKLRYLPDPIMGSDDHYLPFEKAYTTTLTTEMYRPSLRGKKVAKPLSFSPSVQHALNTGITVQCEECDMWRIVFSRKKLNVQQRAALQSILEDVSYTCGASLEDLDLPSSLPSQSIVVRDHRCGDIIERLYFSAGYEDICIYCGTTSELVGGLPDTVYPICSTCKEGKEPIHKRKKSIL